MNSNERKYDLNGEERSPSDRRTNLGKRENDLNETTGDRSYEKTYPNGLDYFPDRIYDRQCELIFCSRFQYYPVNCLSEPGAVATGLRDGGLRNPVATAPGSDLRKEKHTNGKGRYKNC